MPKPKPRDAYYFPFGAKDWRSSESVALMSLTEKGAFIDLLSIAWLSSDEPCSIPAGDEEIAALLRITVDEWKRIAPRVLAEFDETTKSGRLRNDRLWRDYQSMRTEHRKRVQGGRTSALRRRDAHGRLLPSESQDTTKSLGKSPSASQSHSQSHSQVKKTTAAKEPPRPSWMLPSSRIWEATFGAGSFPWPEFGRHAKPLKEHHPPALIADRLARYLKRTETQYVSIPRFVKTFAQYAPVDANALVDEFGCLTPFGEQETTKGLRIA